MTPVIKMPLAVVATVLVVASAFAQSSVVVVDKEPAPNLAVQVLLPEPLAQGVVFIPYRLENVRIVPVQSLDQSCWMAWPPIFLRPQA